MIPENLTNCSLCNSNDIAPYMECTDHFVSGERFNLSRCNSCGFVFTNPRPPLHNIAPYYASEEYVSHSKTSAGFINSLFHLSRNYTLWYKKKILRRYASGNTLLDYGCGTGDFLSAMNRSSWTCFGIEPNTHARETASMHEDIRLGDESMLDKYAPASFDAITLWHVLEHVYPLHERLSRFHSILKKQGTLFVAVPNMLSHDAIKYGRYWAAWDLPRHIHHFQPDTISRLLSANGFDLVKTKPMLLDAFYISLLSEKYQHGSSRLISAFATGLRSNLKAYFKNNNYSSLIYIFKKSN